ncbi:MAG: HAD family hydrolase [Chloroflexota bacterium]|nr:HAD family hydrolase [Chloroflexota bacterium]
MIVRRKKTLSFDLTGTLATFKFCNSVWFEGLPKLYSRKNGIGFDEARDYLSKRYDEVGDEAVEWYSIEYWFDRFSLGDGWENLPEQFSHNIEFYPETFEVLEQCSQQYELILLTNAAREFVEIETSSIKKYFSKIISSVSDFGEVKKTPGFYARVCRFLGKEPHELTHVGDHWQFDYIAPQECGLTTLFLDRTRQSSGEFIIHDLGEIQSKLL